MKAAAHGLTDPGLKRTKNDDFFLVDEDLGLYVVCDGVGGHPAGNLASRLCAENIQNFVRSRRDLILTYRKAPQPPARAALVQLMRQAVEFANSQVHEFGEAEAARKGMSTTVEALLVLPDFAALGHVGDSRTYLVRAGRAHALTDDHKVAAEMVRQGAWTEEQARKSPYRHVLSRAIGVQSFVQVDALQIELAAGDQFLLCTDGLADYLPEPTLLDRFFSGAPRPAESSAALVAYAKEKGGHDNITVLTVRIEGPTTAAAATPARADLAFDALKKTEALSKVPLFRYLSYAELTKVLAITSLQQHPAGSNLLEEGAPSGEMFILLTGAVQIVKSGQVVAERGQGEFFGEMGLLDSAPRSASVRTSEPTLSMALSRKELLALLRQESQIAVKFLWAMNQEISQRLRITTEDLALARAELKMLSQSQDVPFPLPALGDFPSPPA